MADFQARFKALRCAGHSTADAMRLARETDADAGRGSGGGAGSDIDSGGGGGAGCGPAAGTLASVPTPPSANVALPGPVAAPTTATTDDDDGGGGGDSRPTCYASLITSDDFLPGVQVLLHSLSKTLASPAGAASRPRPVVVLVTAQVSPATRARLAADCAAGPGARRIKLEIIEVPAIPNPNDKVHVKGWVNAGYTKLHVFNLTRFRKVVYIDADALVLENIEDLFARPGPVAAAPDVFPPDKFNAGVMVVTPSAGLFADMRARIGDLLSHDGGDTGFLNSYFPDWFRAGAARRLPFRYNAQRTMHWLTSAGNPGYWQSIRPVAILHFSSNPKPWDNSAAGKGSKKGAHAGKKGELEMIWWHFFMESQMGFGFNLPGMPFEDAVRRPAR